MKLFVLVLSDIHVSSDNDSVLGRAKTVGLTCSESARSADVCLIAVTGDLTYSAKKEQFDAVGSFLKAIKCFFEDEGCKRVEILTVPGNHDCSLDKDDLPRQRLIEGLIKSPSDAQNVKMVDACTEVQQNYFEFRAATTTLSPKYEDRLWAEYEIDIGGKQVRLSAINASWMSSLHEKPGTLVFPIENYHDLLAEPVSARFVFLHHPLNWYVQGSYHPLRVALRSHAAAIFSGHEHIPASGCVQDSDAGASLFFEAPALQPPVGEGVPGFVTVLCDFSSNELTEQRYECSDGLAFVSTKTNVLSLETERVCFSELKGLTSDFEHRLQEPGADFRSSSKSQICLDDFYVYPELKEVSADGAPRLPLSDSEALLSDDPCGKKIILLGEQSAGKTSLLIQAFKVFRKRDLSPIYLKCSELKGQSDLDISKFVHRAIEKEYLDNDIFKSVPRAKLIALVDDLERIPGGGKATAKLLTYLDKQCCGILATASTGYEFGELVHREAWEATKLYKSYEILQFGSRLKHRLIKKWCLCGSVNTVQELEAKVHFTERTLNTILGKNLVPRVPIYILILLQSIEQGQQDILTNSHIGAYYGYMIDRNLAEAGIPASRLVEIKGYLSELAWFYKSSEIKESSLDHLVGFNRRYSDVQNTVDLTSRLEDLVRAGMLVNREDCYSFKYPYIYYYFVGKYLARNLSRNPNLKEKIASWCASLHQSDHAHCVLFLVHHVNDEWVIEKVADELGKCFGEKPALCFEGDVEKVNALVEKASQLVLEMPDVEKNQDTMRRRSDEIAQSSEGDKVGDGGLDEVNRYNQLFATAAILGQILKGYYGDIPRSARQDLIKCIFFASLRFLGDFVGELTKDPEALVSEIEKQIKGKLDAPGEQDSRGLIKQHVFQFLGVLSTLVFKRVAQNVTTDDLKEDIRAVVDNVGLTSVRLIQAASYLERPGSLPIDELKLLGKTIEKNPFAYGVLQTLAALHIQYFHMRDRDRQQLCAATGIALVPPRPSELIQSEIMKVSEVEGG